VATLERLSRSADPVLRRASVLALGFLGGTECNDCLGPLLADPDRRVRLIADDAIKSIWSRAGSPRQRQQLVGVFRMLQCGQYQQALQESEELLAQQKSIPEAYSQRALARYYLEDSRGAIEDCQRAIDLNPYHYLAWIGMGHAYLDLSEPIPALECFRNALHIYPDLDTVRVQIRRLERAFQEPRSFE
jgi:tetratricopeptide (TPR) repeat protein